MIRLAHNAPHLERLAALREALATDYAVVIEGDLFPVAWGTAAECKAVALELVKQLNRPVRTMTPNAEWFRRYCPGDA